MTQFPAAASGHKSYRPEIDGLRAVAVLPVVLFHAEVPGLSGGFVGVDVFFVISGYLITGILADDIARGRFSIADFYARRIRRIFPALFAMLAVSALLALWLLLPFELEDFAASLMASAFFWSNFHFMQGTGYFIGPAETKPLLHMWSLAVEEQFYIFFPPCLYLLSRRAPRWTPAALLAALLLSLWLSVAMTRPQSDAAFYYTPARVWELLAGALLALSPGLGQRVAARRWLAEALAAAGLGLIAVAILTFDPRTLFPGYAALAPVAGAALVILAAPGTLAGRALSVGPIRFVGLISYSLYLWHWPLLVFYRFWSVAPPTPVETAAVVALSFVAAILSWRFVEQPFRRARSERWPLFAGGAAAMAAAALFGAVVLRAGGFPGRVPPEVLALAAVREDEVTFFHCNSLPRPGDTACVIGGGTALEAGFLVWGDSHAGALLPAFDAAAARTGTTGLYMGSGGCVPLIGVNQFRDGFQGCSDGADLVFRTLAAQPEIGTVFLIARWANYAMGVRFLHEAGHPAFLLDADSGAPSFAENARVFERGLERTLGAIRALGRRAVIVSQVPENEFDLAVAMARARWLGREVEFAPARADFEERQALQNRLFAGAEARGLAEVLDLAPALCPAERCRVIRDGLPLYRDSNHLTRTHARDLGPLFEPALAGSAAGPGPELQPRTLP